MFEPNSATVPRRRGAVGVIVRDGRLLVIRRSVHVVAPRKFCFPGGGIQPGESETDALERELREELAVAVTPLKKLWHSVTPWDVELAWWRAEMEPTATPVPHPDEVESVHWFSPEEMLALDDLLESNRQFLSRVLERTIVLD